jgi:hypothetical protein
MCPVCLATAAILAGSATGTGGLTALVVSTFRKRQPVEHFPANPNQKEDHDGDEPDRSTSSQDRLAPGMD